MPNWLSNALGLFSSKGEPTPVAPAPAPVPQEPPKVIPKYLLKSQMAKIKQFLPDYTWAANTVGGGIPPLALASIHYREAEFATTSKIPGGPFQFDPGGSGKELSRRIWEYTVKVCKLYKTQAMDLETNFNIAVLVAAHELKSKIRGSLLLVDGSVDEDVLADAIFGYNGRSKNYCEKVQTGTGSEEPHWKWSPYVSSDPNNGVTLKLIGTLPDENSPGGRKHIETVDGRAGALIIYREILVRSQELS